LVQNFLIGILGNIASAVVIAIIPLTIIVVRTNRRQRHLASFFGLSPGVRAIHVLLSRFQPEKDVEQLAGGVPSSGYVGETVAVDEFLGAQAVRDLFDATWVVASLASIMDGLMSGKRDFGRIDVTVSPVASPETSPETSRETSPVIPPATGTIILMGTGAKESNELAEELLGGDPHNSVYRFVKDERGRAFERMAVRGYSELKYYASDYPADELAVLQRVTAKDGRVTFLCAGKDVSGSRMVAEFLAWNWDSLYEEFRGRNNGDFARLYAFRQSFRAATIVDTVR